MPTIGRVVLVVEVAATCRGKPRDPAYKHAIGFLDHAGKHFDLLPVGDWFAIAQIIRRAAVSICCPMGKRSLGKLDNKLFVRCHLIPSFNYYKQVSINSINVDLRQIDEQLQVVVDKRAAAGYC